MRAPRSTRVTVCIIVAAALAVSATSCRSGRTPSSARATQTGHADGGAGELFGQAYSGDPSKPGYPKAWRVHTIEQAQEQVDFRLYAPDTKITDLATITGIYVSPSGSVALDYPSPSKPTAYILQGYVEVWEAAWKEGDPLSSYEEDIAANPADGNRVATLDGVPALIVQAHSRDAVDGSNAAFVRIVVDGTEVEISGGEDLDASSGCGGFDHRSSVQLVKRSARTATSRQWTTGSQSVSWEGLELTRSRGHGSVERTQDHASPRLRQD